MEYNSIISGTCQSLNDTGCGAWNKTNCNRSHIVGKEKLFSFFFLLSVFEHSSVLRKYYYVESNDTQSVLCTSKSSIRYIIHSFFFVGKSTT